MHREFSLYLAGSLLWSVTRHTESGGVFEFIISPNLHLLRRQIFMALSHHQTGGTVNFDGGELSEHCSVYGH